MTMIKIPVAMATQHPDSASRFLSVKDEIEEAILNFKPFEEGGFGCDEQMVDYEGKLTPYHQPKWMTEAISKELKLVPGKDYLLTPRIPTEKFEEIDRQVMILWSILSANRYSRLYGGDCVKFVISPMVETGEELIAIYRRILKLKKFAEEETGLHDFEIHLIPLVEDVVKMIEIDKIMNIYYEGVDKLGEKHEYFRIFLGKSDASMIYGHLSSVFAIKIGLSKIEKWSEAAGVKSYPIIGVGKLPFRGHLSPENVDRFVKEYSGYRTVTVQSGLRYDVGIEGTKKVIEYLRENSANPIRKLDEETERFLIDCMKICTSSYLQFILPISNIFALSDLIPEQRERMERSVYYRSLPPHIYIMTEGGVSIPSGGIEKFPRAIKFTATLYLIGVPPSLIGTGRALKKMKDRFGEDAVESIISNIYPSLSSDVAYDIQFYDEKIASQYLDKGVMKLIKEDVKELENFLGIKQEYGELGEEHSRILWEIRNRLEKNEKIGDLVLESGKLRGSLG